MQQEGDDGSSRSTVARARGQQGARSSAGVLTGVSEDTGLGTMVSFGDTGVHSKQGPCLEPSEHLYRSPDGDTCVPPSGYLATLSLEDRTENFLVMERRFRLRMPSLNTCPLPNIVASHALSPCACVRAEVVRCPLSLGVCPEQSRCSINRNS